MRLDFSRVANSTFQNPVSDINYTKHTEVHPTLRQTSMIDPRILRVILYVLGVFITIIITAISTIASSDFFSQTRQAIFQDHIIIWVVTFVILLAPLGIWAYVLNLRLFNTQNDMYKIRQEKITTEMRLEEQRVKSRYDIITKIPNKTVWKEDIPKYTEKINHLNHYHIIMADLLNFRMVNDNFGHFIADIVIETVAQDFYGTVRRSESVYRGGSVDVYRGYDKGDEFLFVVEGEEWDALGLLNRICSRSTLICEKIRRKVQASDPRSEHAITYELKFRAGVVPLDSSDDASWAFRKASQSLLKARTYEKELGVRLYWSSEVTVDKINETWKRRIYENAIHNFS
jgi:diguanylate cyclase (GGDEF)-like protein